MYLPDICDFLQIQPKFFIDEIPTEKRKGLQPILNEVEQRYTEFYVAPSDHVAYAFTWYSLCAWGLYTTKKLLKKK